MWPVERSEIVWRDWETGSPSCVGSGRLPLRRVLLWASGAVTKLQGIWVVLTGRPNLLQCVPVRLGPTALPGLARSSCEQLRPPLGHEGSQGLCSDAWRRRHAGSMWP